MLTDDSNLTLSQKYIILLGIAEGMKFLHSISIAYRDLKPSNISIDNNFYPYICDFGESKLSDSNIKTSIFETSRGTPIYMAPEIFSGDPYTYKIDIYSFSLIMYQLITGKPIIIPGARNSYLLANAVQNGSRPDCKCIPYENIKNFISRCWDSNPAVRPSFDEIVEEIKTDKYKKLMKANENDVSKYLNLFETEKEKHIYASEITLSDQLSTKPPLDKPKATICIQSKPTSTEEKPEINESPIESRITEENPQFPNPQQNLNQP